MGSGRNRYFDAIDLDALRAIHAPGDRAPFEAGPAPRQPALPTAAELRATYGDARLGYTATQVADIVGISTGKLDHWTSTGMVTASLRERDTDSGLARLYAFDDIVRVKTLKSLLDGGVTLQRVRQAFEAADRDGIDLSDCTLATDSHSIYALASADEVVDLLGSGQTVIAVAIPELIKQVRRHASQTTPDVVDLAPQAPDVPADDAGEEVGVLAGRRLHAV